MTRVLDFDAFRAEQKSEPLELVLGGKTYHLPPSMPATLALDIIRLQREHGEDMEFPPEEITRMGEALFGGEAQFRAIIAEAAISLEELPELIRMVVELYSGDLASAEGNRAARRAKTGSR